jgi:hypothetical protein
MSFSCTGDYIKRLSGGYIYGSAGRDINYIAKEEDRPGEKFIPCKIIDYDYDDNFIIAAQAANGFCTIRDNPDFYQNKSIIGFWVISNSYEGRVYGPMDLNEYLKTRKELGVPDNLKLKLYL